MKGRGHKVLGLLLFVGSCFAIALYLFNLAGTRIIPGARPYRVQAVVPNAIQLATSADVREAGVKVGRVAELGARGNTTVLKLELEGKYAPVYRDAHVLIRAKSIAGENYVELQPGRPRAGALASGGVLPVDHAEEATQLDQILSVLDAPHRRNLQEFLGGLGNGVYRRGGDLNRLLEASAAVTAQGGPVAQTLGQERDHLAGLIDSVGRVTRALGDRREAIRVLTRQAKVAAEAVASRDAKLRATLGELPPFLRQSRDTAQHLTGFSLDATPVIRDLRLATQELVPAVQDLRPAARAGRGTVRELDRFARAALPATRGLRPFSLTANRFVPPFTQFLRQVNPLFAYLSPYYREMSTFFALNGGWTGFFDNTGHVFRTIAPLSRSNVPGALTPEQDRFLQLASGPAFDTRGTNAFPAPGQAGGMTPFSGQYQRLGPDPKYTAP